MLIRHAIADACTADLRTQLQNDPPKIKGERACNTKRFFTHRLRLFLQKVPKDMTVEQLLENIPYKGTQL